MTVTFRSGDIIAPLPIDPLPDGMVGLTVGMGRKFVLMLGRVRPGREIHWTTEYDPVLDMRQAADQMSARFTATASGEDVVRIRAGYQCYRLRVRVVPMNDGDEEAVALNGSIGTEEPDQWPMP